MTEDVSLVRLYVLRCIYLLGALMLGGSVWPDLLKHVGWIDPPRSCFLFLGSTFFAGAAGSAPSVEDAPSLTRTVHIQK